MEVVRGLVPKLDEPHTLVPGFRAALHGENQPYHHLGAGSTPDSAINALREGIQTNRNLFPINFEKPKSKTEVIEANSDRWTLGVYAPNMKDVRANYNYASSPSAFSGVFTVEKSVRGNCLQLDFLGVNPALDIPMESRDLITFSIDGEHSFYGVLVEHWNDPLAPHPFHVIGTRNNIEGWLFKEPLRERMSVDIFIEHLAQRYFRSPVSFNPEKIRAGEWQIEGLDLEFVKLTRVFDELMLNIPRSEWGVDAEGEFFFYI